jgi:hypothetical protein
VVKLNCVFLQRRLTVWTEYLFVTSLIFTIVSVLCSASPLLFLILLQFLYVFYKLGSFFHHWILNEHRGDN